MFKQKNNIHNYTQYIEYNQYFEHGKIVSGDFDDKLQAILWHAFQKKHHWISFDF